MTACSAFEMSRRAEADFEGLLAHLRERVGDGVRSCVEYTPESSAIRYLREDVPSDAGQARLVRVEELYHASRLAATPEIEDSGLGDLHASVHLFDGAVVVHLLDGSGRVVGVSLDPPLAGDVVALVPGCFEALYGTAPEGLPAFDAPNPEGSD